jgi:hypothetical protein
LSGVLDSELVTGAALGLVAASALVAVPSLRAVWPAVLAAVTAVALIGADHARESLAAGTAVGLAAVAVGGGIALADLERRRGTRLVAVLGVGSLLGMFLTVPDTESILIVLAVVLPAAALALVAPGVDRAPDLAWGDIAFVMVVLWAMAQDGRARPGSIVGGVACLGLLILEPAVHRLVGDDSDGPPDVVLVVVQAVIVLIASRVAGLRDGAAETALLAAAVLAPAALVLVLTTRRAVR